MKTEHEKSLEAYYAYKSQPQTETDYMQIVEASTSTPEDRERAKEALADYASSFKWVKDRGDSDTVAGMFARFRASCVFSGMTVKPLPEPEAARAAE